MVESVLPRQRKRKMSTYRQMKEAARAKKGRGFVGVRNLIPEDEFQLILKGTESDVIKVLAIFNPHILNLNIQHTNLMCRNFQSGSNHISGFEIEVLLIASFPIERHTKSEHAHAIVRNTIRLVQCHSQSINLTLETRYTVYRIQQNPLQCEIAMIGRVKIS